jgi:cardiolipin synthase
LLDTVKTESAPVMVLMASNLNVPNVISAGRLALAPVMIVCLILNQKNMFSWLLLAALLSDIADGVIARVWHLQTNLGAFLDALADMATYLCAICGILVMQTEFLQAHWIEVAIILLFYIVEKIKTWFTYGKPFNAFHTYLSKATAYGQGAFIISLFFWGFQSFLFYPAMALCIAANIEEMILTSLIPTYDSDVRGLYWVLRERQLS